MRFDLDQNTNPHIINLPKENVDIITNNTNGDESDPEQTETELTSQVYLQELSFTSSGKNKYTLKLVGPEWVKLLEVYLGYEKCETSSMTSSETVIIHTVLFDKPKKELLETTSGIPLLCLTTHGEFLVGFCVFTESWGCKMVAPAEDVTNNKVEYISSRISLTQTIVTSFVKVLDFKMSLIKDAKEGLTWIGNHIISQKYLDTFFNPGKRHARNDKVPYLNLKLVIYDSAAIPSQETQNITPNLKVALFFANFVISFDEATHMIVIEDQEKKENFLYQTFYDCNIKTIRKSDEIDQFLSKLAQFNCSWNGTQFYDDQNNNTGHYVISALKFMGIWDSNQLWAKLATNVCERKPLEKHVVVNPDFFHMDSKNNIPAMLSGDKGVSCPRLKLKLTDYIKSQTDAPFRYTFSGYSEDEAQLARAELEFFCTLLSGNYLRNTEDGVRVQRLLKKIMQTNYGESITPETWAYLKPLSDKHNQTFHKQMYNFPGFYKLVNPTPESQNLEKNIAQIWDSEQQDRMGLN